MNITQKLEEFAKITEKEAEQKRRSLTAVVEKTIQEEVEKQGSLIEVNIKKWLSQMQEEIVQENNKVYGETAACLKKEVIERRQTLTDELFEAVAAALKDFTTSKNYQGYLEELLKAGLIYGQDATVTVMARDQDLISRILAENHVLDMKIDTAERDFIGGFIMTYHNSNLMLDHTLKTKLNEAKYQFKAVKITV